LASLPLPLQSLLSSCRPVRAHRIHRWRWFQGVELEELLEGDAAILVAVHVIENLVLFGSETPPLKAKGQSHESFRMVGGATVKRKNGTKRRERRVMSVH